MTDITMDPSERGIIISKTGGGKTAWMKYVLRQIEPHMKIVIIDPNELWLGRGKGGHAEDWAHERRDLGTVDRPRLIDEFNPKWHVQCLQPDVDGDEEDPRLAKVCYAILKHENVFVYFDESEGIATATHVPRYIRRIWKTGRAHNIGAWVGTQAPKGIPKIFKSQAEKFVVLKVGDEDVDTAAAIVHAAKEEVADLGRFEWLYYDNKSMEHAVWNPPIPFEEKAKQPA